MVDVAVGGFTVTVGVAVDGSLVTVGIELAVADADFLVALGLDSMVFPPDASFSTVLVGSGVSLEITFTTGEAFGARVGITTWGPRRKQPLNMNTIKHRATDSHSALKMRVVSGRIVHLPIFINRRNADKSGINLLVGRFDGRHIAQQRFRGVLATL